MEIVATKPIIEMQYLLKFFFLVAGLRWKSSQRVDSCLNIWYSALQILGVNPPSLIHGYTVEWDNSTSFSVTTLIIRMLRFAGAERARYSGTLTSSFVDWIDVIDPRFGYMVMMAEACGIILDFAKLVTPTMGANVRNGYRVSWVSWLA